MAHMVCNSRSSYGHHHTAEKCRQPSSAVPVVVRQRLRSGNRSEASSPPSSLFSTRGKARLFSVVGRGRMYTMTFASAMLERVRKQKRKRGSASVVLYLACAVKPSRQRRSAGASGDQPRRPRVPLTRSRAPPLRESPLVCAAEAARSRAPRSASPGAAGAGRSRASKQACGTRTSGRLETRPGFRPDRGLWQGPNRAPVADALDVVAQEPEQLCVFRDLRCVHVLRGERGERAAGAQASGRS